MGCDIHGVLEVLMPMYGTSEWNMVVDIGDVSPRDYELFSYLFGVRGRSSLPFGHRGFPPHISWRTKWTYCDRCEGDHPCNNCGDYHSLSYLTWNELKPHLETVRTIIGDNKQWELFFWLFEELARKMGNDTTRVIESTNVPMVTTGEYDTSKVRMIVWFDN